MAKKKKGYQEFRKYQIANGSTEEYTVNLKKCAEEFAKLLGKKYHFLLSNGQSIILKFEEGNFYHLLGFHKFTNTIFFQMIEQDAYDYNATNFYNDVLDEKIKFDWWDDKEISVPPQLMNAEYYKNFIDQKDDIAKNVIYRRFPYFTYDNVISMFNNKVVIDHDSSQSESDVRADKIFFVFLAETNRNLNFGVDFNYDGYFPTTFFLENKKDWFKYKKDGKKSDILDILGIYVEDAECGKSILFHVNWRCVREKFLAEHDSGSYIDMKKMFNKEDVTSYYMKRQIEDLYEITSKLDREIDELNEKVKVCELKLMYLENPSNEEPILELMNWEIDAENENIIESEVIEEKKELLKELSFKSKLCKKHKKKIGKIEGALPDIQQMDKIMLQEVYNSFIDNSIFWPIVFWDELINKIDWIKLDIDPVRMKGLYKGWRSNNSIQVG